MTEAQKNAKNDEYIDSLKDEVSYLKEILASKLFEEDNLINFTCREIETDYSLKFGVYKYKIKDYKLKIKKTKRTIEMIKEFGLQDKIIFSSFNHFTVKRCEELAPEIKRGFLTGDWLVDFGKYTKERNVQCCHPWHISLSQEVVDEMHAAGCEINTWTVNEYADIERLSALGVDALIGNFPDRMIEKLR